MDLKLEPKNIFDAYSTPIVQQTSFWSLVKEKLGLQSCTFEYSVRNKDLYQGDFPSAWLLGLPDRPTEVQLLHSL